MSDELNQCPCCPATKCVMDMPCLGCETYAEWHNKKEPPHSTEPEKCEACGGSGKPMLPLRFGESCTKCNGKGKGE